ncbi:MAG: hypothetical protein U0973_05860, partial [Xanthomonadaceae bacterium]|nr:hypothetical protein [Xanthomonadaceae bacterium]
RTDQQQQQQQSAARRTTKRTAKAKTAAAVLDNRLLIEGWVERSETHRLHLAMMGFAVLYPSYGFGIRSLRKQ